MTSRQLLAVTEALIDADADEGISTDELMTERSGLNSEEARGALYDLERQGHRQQRYLRLPPSSTPGCGILAPPLGGSCRSQEEALRLTVMREKAPDMALGETYPLHLRQF